MKLIHYEVLYDHIGFITLNRPHVSNAMSKALLEELNSIINHVKNDRTIYVLIITGSGSRSFCAGADLKERNGLKSQDVLKAVRYINHTLTRIENLPIPVIALINGAAIGGGLELALACDIRVAYPHATFGLTETTLAIIPGAGGTQRLPRLIGIGQAKRLIYSGHVVQTNEALDIGLIELIIAEVNERHAIELAQRIVKNGPIAVRQSKRAINKGIETNLQTGLEIEQLCYEAILYTEDRLEGLNAFRERRQPSYRGK